MHEGLWRYLRRDKRAVAGWLQRVDAEIIGAILQYQFHHGITGSCVEIGVHHGKSFIPLCMTLQDKEQALCIDLFEHQDGNIDRSGKGDFKTFQRNIAKYDIDVARVHTVKGTSEAVSPEDILAHVGPVRFFSIDGGHWRSIVQSDLKLAEGCLGPTGVIALDDYCRADWPDVTHGYALWQSRTQSDIIPFAIGSNKLYLCRKRNATLYRGILKTGFLIQYFSKTYRTPEGEVDCYRIESSKQDEEGIGRAARMFLKVFRPDLFFAIRKWLRAP
jgi:hypothetical protein